MSRMIFTAHLFRLLNKEIKDQDKTEGMLEELSGYIIRDDWEIPEIMNCLYDWNVVFGNDRMMERLVEALGRWLNSIRRWSEGGHSRQELYKENTDLQYITYAGRSQKVKETEKRYILMIHAHAGLGKNTRNVVEGNDYGYECIFSRPMDLVTLITRPRCLWVCV